MVAAERRFLRVGHKGAAALAPENTIESLAAALAHGVDMVEFDVVDAPDGRLLLAHSHEEIGPEAVSLDDALAFLAEVAPAEVAIDVDLKGHGFEEAVTSALRRHGLIDRAVVCSFFPKSLREVRRLEPRVKTGISYPWDRRGIAEKRLLKPVALAGIATLRGALPYRVCRMVDRARADAAMIHHAVLSRACVERCHRHGAKVYAWTVDDPTLLERVEELGVDGVITNDPRIFAPRGEDRSQTDHHFGV